MKIDLGMWFARIALAIGIVAWIKTALLIRKYNKENGIVY